MKMDGWIVYVEMNFEFKCDWKCESTVCFLIGALEEWLEEIRIQIDLPLETNVDIAVVDLDLDLFPFFDDLVPFIAVALDPFRAIV